MNKILLTLSDPNVGVVLSEYLRLKRFEVELTGSASEAFSAASKERYDFCVLGLDDAEELLQLIADIRLMSDVPIFAVQRAPQASGGPLTLDLRPFEAGADDVLTLPVVPDLLIAKMQAMLRRWSEWKKRLPTVFDFPGVHFDSVMQTLTVNGTSPLHLSAKENGVLLLLCRQANQIVDRSRILKEVWRADNYFNSRSLAVYINRLKHYLEPDTDLRILSMRMRGYKLLVPST